MVHPNECTAADSLDTPFEAFLDSKAAAGGGEDRTGTYVSQLERVVGAWIEQMNGRGVDSFATLDERVLAQWVDEYLAQRVRAHRSGESGISAGSANTYYDYVSAYLEYCRNWGIIDENPAATAIARDPLPERPSRQASEQQFWTPAQRNEITEFVRSRASRAIERSGRQAISAVRDQALVYTLGYSGVRGAEILRLPRGDDERRTGVTWADLDFEAMTLQVLGKSQNRERVPLTDKPLPALRRLYDLLDPTCDDWPLFPTFHAPTLWKTGREQLGECETDRTVDEILEATEQPLDLYRKYDLCPPAMTTEGARHLLKRLTANADIELDGEKSYLTLHGARRGVGEQYYREASPATAQRALRHADPRTTSEMYAHIEASELSAVGSSVFESEQTRRKSTETAENSRGETTSESDNR